MCVIMAAEKVRPTEEMMSKGWDDNDDGAGVAWREETTEGKVVVWQKGFENVEDVKKFVAKLPLPFILHFRKKSIGDAIPPLTHPFPLDKRVPCALKGRTKGYVLFHNGTWTNWADHCRDVAIKSGVPVPMGKWSDTRGLAWICSIVGPGFLEFLPDQKGVIFGPNDYEIMTGRDGWKKVNEVWCSNDYFTYRSRTGSSTVVRICKYGQCRITVNLDSDGYCPLHPGGRTKALLDRIAEKKDAESGGTQSGNVTPFRASAQGSLISLGTAERLSSETNQKGERKLSRNKLKRVRGWYADLALPNPKKALHAREQLLRLSLELEQKGLLTH